MRPRGRLAATIAVVGAALAVPVAAPDPALADSWTVAAEAGAELDSNVQRVETGPGLDTSPVTSGLVRLGARVDRRARAWGGAYTLNISNLTRLVTEDTVAIEDVTVLAGNLRYIHGVNDRPVMLGGALTAVDALPLSDDVGARTFRNLGADALLVLRGGEDRTLTLGFGWRDFVYRPDPDFDWRGPAANARLELVLWQPASKTRSLELVTTLGFESRTFDSIALVNACAPNTPADPMCTAATDLGRRDRYQRLGVEVTWVGRQVVALGYQLALIDSNSYGQSLARHRVNLAATAALPGGFYGTLLAILQLDQYLDGLIVRRDLQSQQFTNIEDENRSSLQLRLARRVYSQWSLETRVAIWRNLIGSAMELDFQRELVYLGVTYNK
jgi:hypothetical protein